ncbi:FAD-linked oxidoreductase virF [Paramyrothecium foliicola]|nr:FAD-linked oxidoreductase virF [Paramyrothecium foliicola]
MASRSSSYWLLLLLWATFCAPSLAVSSRGRVDLRRVLTDPARKWVTNTTVSFPGSLEFNDATERWTIFRPPTYSATIRPGTEGDIVKIIRLVTSLKIPFLVRGAGHSYTTTVGDLEGGLNIDLSQFKSIGINKSAKTVTIGPGVTAGDIFDPVYAAGFEIQTGSCSCPSLIGVTLGGGVGRFQGHHGLLIDALVSMRVVTAKGQLIEVSRSSNADLFWGMRGAGANFGVVTSATYALKPLTNGGNFFNIEFVFPAKMAPAYFRAIETYNKNLPAKLASINVIQHNAVANETQVLAGWTYFGSEKEGRRALAPIIALSPPVAEYMVQWNLLTASAGGGIDQFVCQGNTVRDLYNLNLKHYSASTYEKTLAKMTRFYEENPGGRNSVVTLELFPNQAMASVASDETAFRWRDATGYVSFINSNPTFIWTPGDKATEKAGNKLGKELRRDFAATSGYTNPAVFVSYARGDEKLEDIYGKDKLPRLARLKKKWDPENFFSFNNRLPTKYP